MKVGLALSGGGVRGAAHIGILKAFEENGIKIDYISGSSAGSIVAALYAVGYSPVDIEKIFLDVNKSIIDFDYLGILKFLGGVIAKKNVSMDGLIKGKKLEELVEKYAAQKASIHIKDVKVPLAIPAVDINTSHIVMFTSYPLTNDDDVIYQSDVKVSEAVRASIALPALFKPKILNGIRLVDGGVRESVPIKVLKDMGADRIIAVTLGYCGEHDQSIDNIFEVTSQTIEIMSYSIFKYESQYSDFLLKPKIYNVKLLEVDKIPECINRAYVYASKIAPNIKNRLSL